MGENEVLKKKRERVRVLCKRREGATPDLRSSRLAAECDFRACQRDDECPTESSQSRGRQITHGAEKVSLLHQSLQPLFFPRDVQSICLSLKHLSVLVRSTANEGILWKCNTRLPPLTLFRFVQDTQHCLKGPGSRLYS